MPAGQAVPDPARCTGRQRARLAARVAGDAHSAIGSIPTEFLELLPNRRGSPGPRGGSWAIGGYLACDRSSSATRIASP
jgi:hypothetical protein